MEAQTHTHTHTHTHARTHTHRNAHIYSFLNIEVDSPISVKWTPSGGGADRVGQSVGQCCRKRRERAQREPRPYIPLCHQKQRYSHHAEFVPSFLEL